VVVTRVDERLVFGPLAIVRAVDVAILVAVILVTRRPVALPSSVLPAVVAIGILDMAGNAGLLFAEQTGSLAVASMLSSLYPVTTVVLATIVLREAVTRSHAVGIVLALVAIVLIAVGSA
jgi:drug/metabolite transporter (DMT)-like permease